MVTRPVLFDTCILIDYLRGVVQARNECSRHTNRAISSITWIEVMAGITVSNHDDTRAFLLNFHHLPLTAETAERAAAIRRANIIKLPDAIIQATAQIDGRILVTRNTRDFPTHVSGIHVPYKL